MVNIELKARLKDFDRAVQIASELQAEDCGAMRQIDTYFNARLGRLKIRQINGQASGQVVAYDRPDKTEARACQYDLAEAPDAAALAAALERALGIRCVVRKTRRLFLWKNVRIHLDQVEGLGNFLEFEAVLGPKDDPAEARRDLAALSARFGVEREDILPASYGDMIEPGAGTQDLP